MWEPRDENDQPEQEPEQRHDAQPDHGQLEHTPPQPSSAAPTPSHEGEESLPASKNETFDGDSSEDIDLLGGPKELIGRQQECEAIVEAFTAQPLKERVIYFMGPGGIGKTRLLKEARKLAQERQGILSTNVIDLYHFRYHQPTMMMTTIVEQLEESLGEEQPPVSREIFVNYKAARNGFFAQSGGNVAIEVEMRNRLTKEFIKDYEELARDYVIVLLIDTFEKLHPIIEQAEDFNFRAASRFENWLVTELLAKLPNTIILLAGRNDTRHKQYRLLDSALKDKLAGKPVTSLGVEETKAFIQKSLERWNINLEEHPDLIEQMRIYSEGRPVALSIALSYVQVQDVPGLPLKGGVEQIDEPELIRTVITYLQENKPDLANLLTKAFFLRKGLNFQLLARIDREDDHEKLSESIARYARLPFFKLTGNRKGEVDVVVLHDEMYEKLSDQMSPGEGHESYKSAVEYIQELLNERYNRIEREERDLKTEQERRLMAVEQLFYELARNPARGYQQYRSLCNAAIYAHDDDFDTLLQHEFARFFEPGTKWGDEYRKQLEDQRIPWELVIFEESVRWIDRRLNSYIKGKDRYLDAVKMVEDVQQRYDEMYESFKQAGHVSDAIRLPSLKLARYALEAVRLRATMYLSTTDLRGDGLNQAFAGLAQQLENLIDELQSPIAAAAAPDVDRSDEQEIQQADLDYATLILASLYHDVGYLCRLQERYSRATTNYLRAIRLYNELGVEANGLRATALTNLGFARHQQGFSKRGLALVEAALKIAQKYGSPHQIATTLNTLGRIQLRLGRIESTPESVVQRRPDGAEASIEQAYQLFKTLNSTRGRALCDIAGGNVLSSCGALLEAHPEQSKHDRFEQSKDYYQRAIARYHRAIEAFDEAPSGQKPQSELTRCIEARMGLGAAYRERGLLQARYGVDLGGGAMAADLERALDVFNEALALCGDNIPAVTMVAILEDIAFVYVEQGQFEKAREILGQARQHIPSEYDIQPGVGIRYTPALEDRWVYWLRLSQVELQYALCAFRQGHMEEACVRLLRSFASLHTFSPYAPLRRSLRRLGKQELARWEMDHRQVAELRRFTSEMARSFYIPDAVIVEVDELFDQFEGLTDMES